MRAVELQQAALVVDFRAPRHDTSSRMKECPTCWRCWNDGEKVCSDDGTPLESTFAGSVILDGKYRLDRRLGRGGMGVVYRAHHLGLQKTFALKLIASADEALVARFRIEAESLGRLKHSSIVDVTDFGVDARAGGLPYLVMEYLEGITLSDLCRREGRLSSERALPLFESIAEAIDHAHAHGILHLDLKPGNVFVSDNGTAPETVKIVDFGLARFVSDSPVDFQGSGWREAATHQPDAGGVTLPVRETGERARCSRCGVEREADAAVGDPCPVCLLRLGVRGELLSSVDDGLVATASVDEEGRSRSAEPFSDPRCFGTLAYMPPEVLTGLKATRASDLYSFGVLVYELLVGRPPFQGAPGEIIAGHCTGAPPRPSTVNETLPGELDDALLSALERRPERRPPSAAELVRQIRSAVFRTQVRTWREREIPRRTALAAVTAVFLPLALLPVWRSGVVQRVENRSVDARFFSLPARVPDPRLILVSLDEASLAVDPTPLAEKADEFGRELARVLETGARGVAIDLLLPAAWSSSKVFSDLILKHRHALTLAAFSAPGGEVIGPECVNALTAATLGAERTSDLFALVNLDEDADGVTRRARLSYVDQIGKERDTLARRAVRVLDPTSPASSDGPPRDDALLHEAPPRLWIDYSVDWRRFTRISWKDLAPALERQADTFRDRVVLVGGEFVGFGGDFHRVPFRDETRQGVSGLVIQALIANTILSRFHLREPAPLTSLIVTILAVMAFVVTVLLSRRPLPAMLLLVAALTLYVAAAFLLFWRTHVLLPVAWPTLTVVVAGALALALRRALPAFPVAGADRP
jgi:serine/threonine protein kinase